jgi:hypothetical protein
MRLFGKSKDIAPSAQNLRTAPSDAEQVRAKLATVEQDIAQAETKLRQASLAAALSDDPDAGFDTVARLNGLRSRRELLQNALQAAEQQERDRLAALHRREFQAKQRSLSQKAGQLNRDASDVAKATQSLIEARARMTTTASGIAALLPRQLRTAAKPWHEIMSPLIVRDLAVLEAYRHDQTGQKPSRLANYIGRLQDPRTGEVKSITSIIAELAGNLKNEFDRCGPAAVAQAQSGPSAPTAQQALPASSAMQVSSAPATVDVVTPPAPAVAGSAPLVPASEVIDLRGMLGPVPTEAASEPEADPATDTTTTETTTPAPAITPAALPYFTEVTNDA